MPPVFADITDIMGIGIAVLAMMIPIIAILTHHQQKMTALINGSQFPERGGRPTSGSTAASRLGTPPSDPVRSA